MNMKKSIAGVMAGALAVSAMATTASAWTGGDADQSQIVLSYDLNMKGSVKTTSTVTVSFTFADNKDTGYIVKGLDANHEVNSYVGCMLSSDDIYYKLTGAKISATAMDNVTKDTWGIYSADDLAPAWSNAVNNVMYSTKDVVDTANNSVYAYGITFTTSTLTNGKIGMAGFGIDGETKTVETSATYTIGDYTTEAAAKAAALKAAQAADATVKSVAKVTDESNADKVVFYGSKAENAADAARATVTANADGNVVIATVPGNYLICDVTSKTEALAKYEADNTNAAAGETATAKKIEDGANDQVGRATVKVTGDIVTATSATAYGFKNFNVTLTYELGAADATWKNEANIVTTNLYGLQKIDTVDYGSNVIGAIDATATAHVTPAGGEIVDYYSPLESNYNLPGNVINRLTVNGYTYPQAVLNDVIANNENVAFTFTTAQKWIDTRDYVPAIYAYKTANGNYYRIKNPAGSYSTLPAAEVYTVGGTPYVKNPFRGVAYNDRTLNSGDWTLVDGKDYFYNPYFTQDLYQSWTWANLDGLNHNTNVANNGYHEFGPNTTQTTPHDMFGSYASGWNKNLLAAGLVVNSAWTMQLNQATAFEWGDQTVTFFWDDITADKNITNAANFLTSLQLYTPVDWFWDKLDVSVGAAISEDVASNAGLEEDPDPVEEEEVIEEEPADEEVFEEEEPEEEFEEDFEEEPEEDFEEEPEEEEVVEEEVTVEVESPKTGNAPVALAVIPVALAAAAVIAKKKN